MREVPEVLVADLAVLAVGAAQQVRRVQRPVLPFCLDCGYVSRTTTLRHTNTINHIADRYQSRLWLHPSSKKKARPPQTLGIGPQTLKNFRLRSSANPCSAGVGARFRDGGLRGWMTAVVGAAVCVGPTADAARLLRFRGNGRTSNKAYYGAK